MNNDWFIRFRKPLTAGACLLALTMGVPAFAAARTGSMTWRGNVDDVTRIVIRGRSVTAYAVSGKSPDDIRYRTNGDLLTGNMDVRLENTRGRGDVHITQQPSRSNGFTTIVEVRDRQGGAAPYEFRLSWQSDNDDRGEWNRDSRWGNDDRRDDNGRRDNDPWNNNRRDDDRRDNGRRDSDRRDNGRWDRDRRDQDDNARWTREEREAYQQGYDLGQRDRSRRVSRDSDRYRSRYNRQTADEFRRGYNNGYDGARFPGRG